MDLHLDAELPVNVRLTNEQNPRVSVLDVIKSLTKNPCEVWARFISSGRVDISYGYFKFPGQGQRDTPVIALEDVGKLKELIVRHARMPLCKKRQILGDISYVDCKGYTEVEIHDKVCKAFQHLNPVVQYTVDKYRIDLYFPTAKLAIECDEYGHSAYNVMDERERSEHITRVLGCHWIRYDPYAANFCVFDLINKIVRHISG